MAIIPDVPSRQVAPQRVGVPTRRSTATADTFGAAQARATGEVSQFMGEVAKNAENRLREYHTTQYLTNLSNFELQATAGMQELANTVPPDGNFPKVALEMFNEQSQAFMEEVPNFLQVNAHEKMLGVRQNVAKAAIKMQEVAMAAQTKQDFAVLLNNIENGMRHNNMPREQAAQLGAEIVDSLPEYMTEGARNDIAATIEKSTLLKLSDSNPEGTITAIQSGKFNNLDSDFVGRVYDGAIRQRAAAAEQQQRLIDSAYANVSKDPFTAVNQYIAGAGVADTPENRQRATQELGLNPRTMPVMPKAAAEFQANRLHEAGNVKGILSIIEDIHLKNGDQGLRDVSRLGGTSLALDQFLHWRRSAAETGGEVITPDNARVADYWMALVSDPKAGTAAFDLLSKDPDFDKSTYNGAVHGYVEDELVIGERSGSMQPSQLNNARKVMGEAFSVGVHRRIVGNGMSFDDAVKAVSGDFESARSYDIVTDSRNAYTVPKAYAHTLTKSTMESLKVGIVRSTQIPLSVAQPQTRQMRDIEAATLVSQAGWVMGPSGTYRLDRGQGLGLVTHEVEIEGESGEKEIALVPISFTLAQLIEMSENIPTTAQGSLDLSNMITGKKEGGTFLPSKELRDARKERGSTLDLGGFIRFRDN